MFWLVVSVSAFYTEPVAAVAFYEPFFPLYLLASHLSNLGKDSFHSIHKGVHILKQNLDNTSPVDAVIVMHQPVAQPYDHLTSLFRLPLLQLISQLCTLYPSII